jgi:MFS family permease
MLSRISGNAVIRSMVIIEFFATAAYGVIGPIFAIFVADNISGGTAQVAGFAVAIYWISKAVVQLPIARMLDKVQGEHDDFWAYLGAHLAFAFGMFLYVGVETPLQIYVLQAFLGIAYAFYMASMYGLFSRHLDKHFESTEWSLYSVFSYSLATGIATAIGGTIAITFGFDILFILSGILYLVAAAIEVLVLRNNVEAKASRARLSLFHHGRGYHRHL